jgi:signal transduction histidine kinase
LPVNLEPLDSGEVLATVAERFSGPAAGLGRQIEVEDGDVGFDGDPKRIEQALGNLVENALVHGAGTIRLGATRRDGRVELRVADEGPGFPEGFAERAFDRFSRADEARRRSGSGLGLAIVEAIAKAHGGSAGVSPGALTEVWISLPAGPERLVRSRPSLTSRA